MCKTDFNLLVYCSVILGIEKNSTTHYQSPAQSANASVNLKNYGETSPDAISTTSEGAQENHDDLVIISGRCYEEKCHQLYPIHYVQILRH